MKFPPKRATKFRFSTDAFPERERLTAWREVFGRTVVKLDIEPRDPDGFHAEATVCQVPGLGVLSAASSAMHLRHTPELIKDGDLSFMAAPSCAFTASQLGRTAVGKPGDGVLMDNAEVGAMTLASDARFITFRVPMAAIEPLVPDLRAAVARIIPAADVALQLLVAYLAGTLDTGALLAPELEQLAVTHIYDLLAGALGASRDAAEVAKGRGISAARLRAIKSDILAHLGQQGLSLDAVAARHAISPVYIRKLFASEGSSFSQFVLDRRLERAHRLLSDPRFARHTIAALALRAGFTDLSYFNRVFRRCYGLSPSDVRATT